MPDFDNMYPNDGEAFNPFREPLEQQLERKEQSAKVKRDLRLAEELVERWEEKINDLEKVSAITVDVEADTEKFLRAYLVKQELLAWLKTEKEWLEDLITTFKR